jgi:hypothetical protein
MKIEPPSSVVHVVEESTYTGSLQLVISVRRRQRSGVTLVEQPGNMTVNANLAHHSPRKRSCGAQFGPPE